MEMIGMEPEDFREDVFARMFRRFDQDNSGTIEKDEMKSFMLRMTSRKAARQQRKKKEQKKD